MDNYGKPVTLNYRGRDKYTSVPGGLLTITLIIIMISLVASQFDYLASSADWTLTSQSVALNKDDLKQVFTMANEKLTNLSTSVQFKRRRAK